MWDTQLGYVSGSATEFSLLDVLLAGLLWGMGSLLGALARVSDHALGLLLDSLLRLARDFLLAMARVLDTLLMVLAHVLADLSAAANCPWIPVS